MPSSFGVNKLPLLHTISDVADGRNAAAVGSAPRRLPGGRRLPRGGSHTSKCARAPLRGWCRGDRGSHATVVAGHILPLLQLAARGGRAAATIIRLALPDGRSPTGMFDWRCATGVARRSSRDWRRVAGNALLTLRCWCCAAACARLTLRN